MGCGASTKSEPPKDIKDIKTAEAEPEGTWATKTSGSNKQVVSDQVEAFTAPKSGEINSKSQSGMAVTVLDAEDEDGVEVICESPSKFQASPAPSAANGQEPPEAAEPAVAKPVPAPLTEQQQREAARLAEARKRFDGQKYQSQQNRGDLLQAQALPFDVNGSGAMPVATVIGYSPDSRRIDAVGTVIKGSSPLSFERDQPSPTEMMLGLTETSTKKTDDLDYGLPPGSIFDELENLTSVPEVKVKKNQHDEPNPTKPGMDDDDEMLMAEILANCE